MTFNPVEPGNKPSPILDPTLFAQVMTHEFRTDVTVIVAHFGIVSRYLQGIDYPPAVDESLEMILAATQSLEDRIGVLTRLSNGVEESGVPTSANEVFDLGLTVDSWVRQRGHPADEIVWERPSRAVMASGMAAVVGMMLDNIANNAIKYGATPLHLTVATAAYGTPELVARDRGPGLPAEVLAGGFKRRGRGVEHRDIEGTGTGLFFCRLVAEAFGGSMGASNPPEGGAKFVFTFAPATNAPG